ncbi:MAG TPA: P-loop NTPase [Gemmatimonadales bacterium]|nr:P-loop NTPase [Gemmatimonadales bacterium]
MSFRTYFDVPDADRSGLGSQIAEQRRRVAERLAKVRRVVLVMSGKGGVGKSFLTAALARAMAGQTRSGVGVLDADLRSPTVARLLGASGPLSVLDDGVRPAVGVDGIKVMSTEFLLAEGRPLEWRGPAEERFVWRGSLEVGTLREFLSDVLWGEVDVLFIDLPPGADGAVELGGLIPNLTGAVAVTIPSEESRRSVSRTLRAAREAGIRLLGVIENLSGYRCEGCAATQPLFPGNAGAQLAEEFKVALLGRVPFSPEGNGVGDGLRDAFMKVLA